ncbi:MAG: DUF2721 domain-containing protein [Candidatus Bathyarchaeia archaeon]
MLAPAVMITGVALLLLTLNTRHSSIVNRIRLLDDEKRTLGKKLRKERKLDDTENERLRSIETQLNLLLPRLAYVRNGMLCHMLSVLFFVLTSFSISLGYFSVAPNLTQTLINATFIGGMLLVLCGVAFLSVEIYISYRVILIEVRQLQ